MIECVQAINDDIESAIEVICGSLVEGIFRGVTYDPIGCAGAQLGIWYTIQGPGQIVSTRINTFDYGYLYLSSMESFFFTEKSTGNILSNWPLIIILTIYYLST